MKKTGTKALLPLDEKTRGVQNQRLKGSWHTELYEFSLDHGKYNFRGWKQRCKIGVIYHAARLAAGGVQKIKKDLRRLRRN